MSTAGETLKKNSTKCNKWKYSHVNEECPGMGMTIPIECKNCAAVTGAHSTEADCVWNAMAHAQEPDFVFRRNGRVRLNRRGRRFIRLLEAEICASAEVMLDTPCSEVVWRVLAIHSIHQFPLRFPSRASPCAITFQLDCTCEYYRYWQIGL